MKKAVLTICSVNYLAQAKTLKDSLIQHNPEYEFFIGLVDRLDQHTFSNSQLEGLNFVEIHRIGIPHFEDLVSKYNITELNTAVKPFLLKYLYENYPEIEILHYFDPDIQLFSNLDVIEKELSQRVIVLTPHILQPYSDADYYRPNERDHLNGGIYNLGFIGTKRSPTTWDILSWWADRLQDQCFIDLANGMFVDQLWMNLVPNYFPDQVAISRHLGLNMAYWNLHERRLSEKEGKYWVNESTTLIFYHYSGYSPDNPTKISKYQNRFEFSDRHDIAGLFDKYAQTLVKNGYEKYKTYACFYIEPLVEEPRKRFLRVRKYLSLPFRAIVDFIDRVHI